jgi:2-C-methyl-D-erythritol 4-phosphate cytidylyltransferase
VADHTKIPRGGTWCIVVAAGSGRRFGGAKQLELVGDEMVVERSVRIAASVCDGVVLVLTPEIMHDLHFDGAAVTTSGGATRSASVRNGLGAVPDDAQVVLVHDAARPLASPELFERVIDAVRDGAAAAVPAVAVVDTIRSVDGGVVDRDRLRAVQTPQGFDAATLRAAHAGEPEGTDDAGLVEAAGHRVVLVDGEPTNLKITSPHDLAVADLLARLADEDSDPADSDT